MNLIFHEEKYYNKKKDMFFKRIIIINILIILLIFLQCDDFETNNISFKSINYKYGNVVFRVFDDSTSLPVAYTSIRLSKLYKYWGATGKSGISIMLDLPAINYRAEFYAAKYNTLIKEITVTDDDQIIDIYMKKNALIDIIPPEILDVDYFSDPPNLYILFNEGMDRSSVLSAIKEHIWYYYDKNTIVKSFTFTYSWKGDNLLIIKHKRKSVWGDSWHLGRFRLEPGIAVDHSGNVLLDSININYLKND